MRRWRRLFQWLFFRGFTNPEPVPFIPTPNQPEPDMEILRQQLISFYHDAEMGDVYLLAFSSIYARIVELLRLEGWFVGMVVSWDGQVMYEILPQTSGVDLRYSRLS